MPAYHYTLQELEEVYDLSMLLSREFPDPSAVQLGIYELLLNALEHGNLEIGPELKMTLIRENRWEHEIKRRIGLPEFSNRKVEITLELKETECRMTITDQGKGFDWQHYISALAKTESRPCGMGLFLVRHAGFDTILFNEKGNAVTCIVGKK